MRGAFRRSRPRAAAGLATTAAVLACAGAAPAPAAPPAPGAPGDRHAWADADKHGFGTAHTLTSRAWFTLRQAELTEVYYPDLSTPSFRSLEFAVTDGRTFLHRETDPRVKARVTALEGSLTFRQVTETDRWRLTKTWVTDPARATVLADVRLKSRTGRPLQVYVLADPAPSDTGNDDLGHGRRGALTAWDPDGSPHAAPSASAVMAKPGLGRRTSGYAGTRSDPWADLRGDMDLDRTYDATKPGNVVQGARTGLKGVGRRDRMTLAIGFGRGANAAVAAARASLKRGVADASAEYAAGWMGYLDSLKDPPASARDGHLRRVYEQSLMVLDASEDKTHRGASIASPTMPWVWGTLTLEGNEFSGPYHLVWPRDFYHVATAMRAAGDDAAVTRLIDYLWATQKADGSWWQNMRVDGTPHWTNEQLDEIALPIVLAWWAERRGPADWEHVRMAAEYIVANGPDTQQERWENQSGWSPNTIAAQIAALICAADIARLNGDEAAAVRYEQTADAWEQQVEAWTATTRGPYSDEPYYVRVTKDGNPDDGSTYELGDNFPRPVAEWEIVDQSFLALVLFGVRAHDDPVVRNSLAVGDEVLKVETPHGPGWYRFTFDGYGETRAGADWDIFPTAQRQTLGRLWPLLTGERGEYELLAGNDARPHLRMIARTANDGLMLPEQVWDGRPPTGEPGAKLGEGTRSATPLGWTHAQFVRLAWSIDAGAPIETPSVVACRYAGC